MPERLACTKNDRYINTLTFTFIFFRLSDICSGRMLKDLNLGLGLRTYALALALASKVQALASALRIGLSDLNPAKPTFLMSLSPCKNYKLKMMTVTVIRV